MAAALSMNNLIKPDSYAFPAQTGTSLATVSIPIGCAASLRKTAIHGHGGARNRANRTSDSLTSAQCRKVTKAAKAALETGRAFNRFITVHWESAGVVDCDAMAATTAFLKVFREWAGGATYVWTRENGDSKGSHLHILAHIPAGKQWHAAPARRWLERLTGNPYRRGVILTRQIRGARNPDSLLYSENLSAVLAYVLKGASPDTASAIGIAHEAGGRIIGKRCGTSRNIAERKPVTAANDICQLYFDTITRAR